MRRIIISLALAVMAVAMCAQTARIGLKGGLSLSTESSMRPVGGTDAPAAYNNSLTSGLQFGPMLNIRVAPGFEVEPALMYSKQGFRATVDLDPEQKNADANWHVTSHYLQVPLALKVYFIRGFFLEAGPQFSFLMAKKDHYVDRYDDAPPHVFNWHNTKKIDFGVFLGMGYRFTEAMYVEGRYTQGLVETSKLYTGGMNRNFQLSIGYQFRVDKKALIQKKNQLLGRD